MHQPNLGSSPCTWICWDGVSFVVATPKEHMHAKSVEITRLTIGFVDVCSDVVTDYIWLVVWNVAFTFPYIRNVIIPTDELIFFRGVGIPPTRFDGWIYFFFSRGEAPGMAFTLLVGKSSAWKTWFNSQLNMGWFNHELGYSNQKLLPYTPHMPTWKVLCN